MALVIEEEEAVESAASDPIDVVSGERNPADGQQGPVDEQTNEADGDE